jgi:hypothetical protein
MSLAMQNRVHRRITVRNYRKVLYNSSSRAALLVALAGCIEGHDFLHTRAGMRSEFFLKRSTPLGMSVLVDAADTDSLTQEVRSLAWMVPRG